jgi:hypothetical protein
MIQALVPTVRAALECLGRPYLSKERIDMLDLLVLGILLFVGYFYSIILLLEISGS